MATGLDEVVLTLCRQQIQQEATDNLLCQLLPQAGATEAGAAAACVAYRGGQGHPHGQHRGLACWPL